MKNDKLKIIQVKTTKIKTKTDNLGNLYMKVRQKLTSKDLELEQSSSNVVQLTSKL